MKTCSKCKSSENGFYADKNAAGGFRAICKVCDKLKASIWNSINKESHRAHEAKFRENNRQKTRDKRNNYVKNNPNAVREANLKFNYGITIAEFDLMKAKQNNCCAICNVHEDNLSVKLCVDHCHTTEKIRGILCSRCNSAIGFLDDNINTLHRAIEYLKENQ